MRRFVSAVVLGLSVVASPLVSRAADWEAPKDGKLTEKQVTNFVAAHKELMQMLKAMGKAVEGSKTGIGAVAVLAGMDDKVNAVIAKHDLKRPEYDWVNEQVTQAMGAAMLDDMMEKGKADIEAQKKKNADEIAAAQKRVTEYEQANKSGTRVLTAEQKADRIKDAKSQQESALEEAKSHDQEIKDAEAEAKQHEMEAAEAEKLAKNPPSDVGADDRADYIKGKQEEATNAKTAAKESRDRLKEIQKQVADAKAKAAGFEKQMKNPEVPVGDEEKAQVKQENEQGLANAKSELETLTQATAFIKDAEANFQKQSAELRKGINADNLALVKKHLKEVQEAWGIVEEKK